MGDSRELPLPYRLPLLLAGFVCLVAAIIGGLWRLGWLQTVPAADLAALHAPLLLCGFFGTLISLERAVALGGRWPFLAPLAAGLGGLALLAGIPWWLGAAGFVLAALLFILATWQLWRRQPALHGLTLLLGALCWGIGSLLWLGGGTILQALPWWFLFLVFTIAGERLELSRMLPPSPLAQRLFAAILLLLLGATAATLPDPAPDWRWLSAGLVALALWLMKQDVARRTVRQQGLTRYIAGCLLTGYLWLLAAGLLGLLQHPLRPGSSYDAFVHTLLAGFVLCMVFGHAPLILPAVLRVRLSYRPLFYLPLLVLHASLLLRCSGDLLPDLLLRRLGGLLQAVALGLFILTMAGSVWIARRA